MKNSPQLDIFEVIERLREDVEALKPPVPAPPQNIMAELMKPENMHPRKFLDFSKMDGKPRTMKEVLKSLQPAGEMGGVMDAILSLFDYMEIAEQVIDAELESLIEGTDAYERVWASFTYMRPSPLIPRHLSLSLHRAHCTELAKRASQGTDMEPVTRAEMCVMFMQISLAAPLTSAGTSLYWTCFTYVFPRALHTAAFKDFNGTTLHEPWDGYIVDELARIQNKHRIDRTG